MYEPTCPEKITYLSFSDYLLELDGTFVTQNRTDSPLTDNEIIVRDALPLISQEISSLMQEVGEKWDDSLDPCSLRDAISVAVSGLRERIIYRTDFPEDLGSFRRVELGFQVMYGYDLSKLADVNSGKSVAANLLIEFFKEKLPSKYVDEISRLYLPEDEMDSTDTLGEHDPEITWDSIEPEDGINFTDEEIDGLEERMDQLRKPSQQ